MTKKVLIIGAAGRDFHNFNVLFRDKKDYEVVCFTAAQIPGIAGRKYPTILAGKLYKKGIPIYDEKELETLIKTKKIDITVFSYSDVPHTELMHKASLCLAAGADFWLIAAEHTMLKSTKKVISICAIRTGCGKSQTTRKIAELLEEQGKKVAVIRHPMPYGDLSKMIVQRFATLEDLKKQKCTIEEMEEYEPHIIEGRPIYAGVDYEKILRSAEKEADIILWDGGNNDTSFYKPDCEVVVVDPLRLGHETSYYPGEVNLRRAHIIVINKVNSAKKEDVEQLKKNIQKANPKASIILSKSIVKAEESLKGKKVLIVEDGPTVTHGGMTTGAALVAAKQQNAHIIEPDLYLVGDLKKTFMKYPHLKHHKILPAMGYGRKEVMDLATTINKAKCDIVVTGTPIDLRRVFAKEKININKKIVHVKYYSQMDDKKFMHEIKKRL